MPTRPSAARVQPLTKRRRRAIWQPGRREAIQVKRTTHAWPGSCHAGVDRVYRHRSGRAGRSLPAPTAHPHAHCPQPFSLLLTLMAFLPSRYSSLFSRASRPVRVFRREPDRLQFTHNQPVILLQSIRQLHKPWPLLGAELPDTVSVTMPAGSTLNPTASISLIRLSVVWPAVEALTQAKRRGVGWFCPRRPHRGRAAL
jgi:hypothetical protein